MEAPTFDNLQDLEEQDFEQLEASALKHVGPFVLFSPYFIRSCMQLLKYDSHLQYIPFVSTLLPLDDGLDMGRDA
jgi:hypothetical protein